MRKPKKSSQQWRSSLADKLQLTQMPLGTDTWKGKDPQRLISRLTQSIENELDRQLGVRKSRPNVVEPVGVAKSLNISECGISDAGSDLVDDQSYKARGKFEERTSQIQNFRLSQEMGNFEC
jgi:hypothetical protein